MRISHFLSRRTKTIRYASFFLALFLQDAAVADIYQCDENGQTHYSQTACTPDQKQLTHSAIAATNTPSKEAQQAAKDRIQRDKAELKKIEQQRTKEQVKQEKATTKQVARSQQHKAMCDKAQLSVKWAKEDVNLAAPKSEAKAKLKLKRSKEKAALACQTN